MLRRVMLAAVVLSLVAACTGNDADETVATATTAATTTTAVQPIPGDAYHWWNDRVFYEIFVRSFKDSDGDGVGDFAGLTASLDYLNDGDPDTTDDLGITGIWLMPIFPSPSYHGYDVTDYRDVNPDYGTMEEFRTFLDAAHDRGIAVIIDFVINHTSDEHPWFEAADAGDPSYRDWYIWSETDLRTPGIFAESAWHEGADGYYFGLFVDTMPDFNLENPDVTAELRDIARFWLTDVGVDGFRLDAVAHLIEDGAVTRDTPQSREWLAGFTEYVHDVSPNAMVLGEVWSSTMNISEYVPESMDLGFEFGIAEATLAALQRREIAAIRAAMERVVGAYPDGQYARFLTNHDQDRLMSVVDGDLARAELAATLLLTSPGVPFIYYGEEVGQLGQGPHQRIRTPMPWTGEEPGVGFTSGEPWENVAFDVGEHNVAVQRDDPASLLSLYRTLIRLRTESSALRNGDLIDVETGSSEVLAYLRSDGVDHVLVVANLGTEPVTSLSLDLADGPLDRSLVLTGVAGQDPWPIEVSEHGGFLDYQPVFALPPSGYLVYRFQDHEPTTTATDDASVAEAFLMDIYRSEPNAWMAHLAPTASFSGPGFSIGLYEQTYMDFPDWDENGWVSVADNILAENAYGSVFGVDVVADCKSAVNAVECRMTLSDVFDRLEDSPSAEITQTFRVENGLITDIGLPVVPDGAAVEAWNRQFLRFEEWVDDVHPEQYVRIFSGSCCSGDGSNIVLKPTNLHDWEALLGEWLAE